MLYWCIGERVTTWTEVMQHDLYWLLDMFESTMVRRDANDFQRKPPVGGPALVRTVQSAQADEADVKQRIAESSPENPQGGQWVRFHSNITGFARPRMA